MNHPHALIFPESWKQGRTQIDRIDSILAIAEPLLGVDRSQGERAYIRRQPGGHLFITKDPQDTLQFRVGHPREGKSRYNWVVHPDGSQHGFLIDVEDAAHA